MGENKDKIIDDMVNMIDRMISQGTGHIIIDVNEENLHKSIKTSQSSDSADGCFACRITNLDDGSEEE